MTTNPYGQTTGQQTAAPTILSYGQFHQPHAGTYPAPTGQYATYQTTPYATAVTSYGSWHYGYGYMPAPPHAYGARPSTITESSTAAASTPQRYTFSAYRNPTAATPPTTGRAPRKQSHFKGIFAKERESPFYFDVTVVRISPKSEA
jgi:hypothetical protein